MGVLLMHRPILLLATSSLIASAVQADCIDDAAQHHQVNAYVLRAIGWQESRLNPEAVHRNANGTTDFGAFQINSIHLSTLRRTGITPDALRDGCVSAYVGAWHYRLQLDRFGNTWSAIGAYHSTSPALNHLYANEIAGILRSWGALAPGSPPFPDSEKQAPRRLPSRETDRTRSLVAATASNDPTSQDNIVFDSTVSAEKR
jgi:hypothetical protein